MEHVLIATVFAHPLGRQFAKQTITFFTPSLKTAENKAVQLKEVLCSSLNVTEAPAVFVRFNNPAADGGYEYAILSADSAMEWLVSTAGQQQPEGDPRWQDGRPALWVKLPAEPAAATAAAAQSTTAGVAATSSSREQHSTATDGPVNKHTRRSAAVGDTEVAYIGPAG